MAGAAKRDGEAGGIAKTKPSKAYDGPAKAGLSGCQMDFAIAGYFKLASRFPSDLLSTTADPTLIGKGQPDT